VKQLTEISLTLALLYDEPAGLSALDLIRLGYGTIGARLLYINLDLLKKEGFVVAEETQPRRYRITPKGRLSIGTDAEVHRAVYGPV
jgi:DNA-binding PadR family transcriptional regulator